MKGRFKNEAAQRTWKRKNTLPFTHKQKNYCLYLNKMTKSERLYYLNGIVESETETEIWFNYRALKSLF